MIRMQLKSPRWDFCLCKFRGSALRLFDSSTPSRAECSDLSQSELATSVLPFGAEFFQIDRLIQSRNLQVSLADVRASVPCRRHAGAPIPVQISAHFALQLPADLQLPSECIRNADDILNPRRPRSNPDAAISQIKIV